MKFKYMGEKIILFSISCCLLQRSRICSLIYCSIVELTINHGIYIHVPFYPVQLLSQGIENLMSQLSNTQRYVATADYNEMR